jgi:hypothetical protein
MARTFNQDVIINAELFVDGGGIRVRDGASIGRSLNVGNDLVVAGNQRVDHNATFLQDISVGGDMTVTGADCAEYFRVPESAHIEPGMALALRQEDTLEPCEQAYDKKVAGVVSGAGDLRPGIFLHGEVPRIQGVPLWLATSTSASSSPSS